MGLYPALNNRIGYIDIINTYDHNQQSCYYIISHINSLKTYSCALQYNSSGTEWTYIFSRGGKLAQCLRWSHLGSFQLWYGNWAGCSTDNCPYDKQYWHMYTINTTAGTVA